MKKIIKCLSLAAICVISLFAFAFAATACGGENSAEQFNVTVVYSDGSAVNGHTDGTGIDTALNLETVIKVQFCDAAEEACGTPKTLGTDGKLSVSAEAVKAETMTESAVTIKLMGVPDGWTYNKITNATAGDHTITVTKP